MSAICPIHPSLGSWMSRRFQVYKNGAEQRHQVGKGYDRRLEYLFGSTPLSIKNKPSDMPATERDLPTEIVSFGGTGPIGTGTLAFEPGFSLDTNYAGEAPAFEEGSKFGVYVVGPCIGEGGMARVYRAEHAGLKRQVALKVMTQGFARDSEGRERFLREARIAAAIKHPNVVNIFDVGVCQGIPYLVMELLEGEDLEKVLLAKGALDEGTIIDLVVPVVAGLVAVHDAGIVHRDLKPGNIFLARGRNDEFEPKLLDFGISKASGKDHLRLTAANGSLMGTPFYMAPEAVQGAEMTPLSDQYALGVVLRECATGKNPFEGNNFAEVVGLISNARYNSISEVNPRLSKRFVAIIERSMSLDPRNRFEDMRAMGRQLLLLAGQRTRITWGLTFGQEGRGPMASLASLDRRTMDAVPQPPPPPPRGRRATAMLLAGVALLSAGITIIFLTDDRSGPSAAPARVAEQRVMPSTPQDSPNLPGSASDRNLLPSPEPALVPTPIVTSRPPSEPPTVAEAADESDDEEEKASEPRKRVVTRPERKPARPAPAPQRRRPAPPAPVATTVSTTPAPPAEEGWEITASKGPSKPDFELGSNAAPILD
jgi:eukaryotic-like serine/threonine-protein kinase